MNPVERRKKILVLLKHLQETNMRPHIDGAGRVGINAELLNEVAAALGCEGKFAINVDSPKGVGSRIEAALIYQNLLLAKRIEALEYRLDAIS